jgi:exodeoxyribonuclease V alpha subunit
VQILSAVRAGRAGVQSINQHFHHLRSPGRPALISYGLAVGDPVMFTWNDYERDLFNGSLGHLTDIRGPHDAVAVFDRTRHALDAVDLESLELAYCITIHKAQGSQFSRVVVPVFPGPLLDRTLLYTAVTRAIDQVVLIGDIEAFEHAVIATPAPRRRETGLPMLLSA